MGAVGLAVLAMATISEAFVSKSTTLSSSTTVKNPHHQRQQDTNTQLNSMWRNWIPRTTNFLDVAAGESSKSNNHNRNRNHNHAVLESRDENDALVERRTVSLVAESSSQTTHDTLKQTSTGRYLAVGAAAALFLAASSSTPLAAHAVSGGGLDFAGLDISNQDFSNKNFKGKDFTQVLARNTNFAGSNFAGCRFPKAYLISANYEGANIQGVSFEGTNMEDVNLKNANAAGAYFGATIIDAKSIENVDFTDAQFPPKTLALMCEREDMKGTNPTTGADTRESAMCP